ncbi:probable methyltransferase PMT27 [Vicia villosa]|uniref:probable methyltransferase PMT27 n=1 Tax=Vicia villosa TaxID=3911 RepID=UPI00273C1CC6|nr:probable methyltransferase PMT27 [Vicia villosa]
MAPPIKSRNRRSSTSSSYTSTLTTLVFIALCVLGVWMLTSNSVVSPKTHSAVDTSTTNDFSSNDQTTTANNNNDDDNNNNNNNNSDELASEKRINAKYNLDDSTTSERTTNANNNIDDSISETTNNGLTSESSTKNQDQKETTTVFGDNPGNLPDDAIKNDDANNVVNTNNNEQTKQEDKSSFAQNQEPRNSNNDQKIIVTEKDEVNAKGDQQQEAQDDANEQQLKEDKGESEVKMSKVDEPKEQENESHEEAVSVEKPKPERKRRKSRKELKKQWSTQADESRGEKERQNVNESGGSSSTSSSVVDQEGKDFKWTICNVTSGADYIPCLDNEKYLKTSHRKHFEHRERHCPEDAPTCLVSLPQGYKIHVPWPGSRDKIWYHNVPHVKLAEVKGHQNWVKLMGEFLTFPGGGTQFIHGALHYIDFLQQAQPDIAWGKHTRVILDVGCGVGSFGGYLFERDVIAMSFAPKDEHEAQVQFGLERGIPAISAVMGTQRLQFPSRVFDLIHCARCRVPWHEEGGMLLLELNRVLRPGGYFVWSATPVYQTLEEDVEIWKQMKALTKSMCWDLVTIKNDTLNQVGAAFFRKTSSNECYEQREQSQPPMCKDDDDPNAAWYVPLQACMHKLPADQTERGAKWPEVWPQRLQKAPYWLNDAEGEKLSTQNFAADSVRWKNVVFELRVMGVDWPNVRNVMDMRATYGGFAAALKDLPLWVFNVVNVDAGDTLPIIYERGLIGMYHDWCESFSTYPRTYDLLHADQLFSNLKTRCKLIPVIAEVDRVLRPGGHFVVRDDLSVVDEVENLIKSINWEITSKTSKNQEGMLCAKKSFWRPDS